MADCGDEKRPHHGPALPIAGARLLGHQPQAGVTIGGEVGHDAHDVAVEQRAVTAQEDPRLPVAFGQGFELDQDALRRRGLIVEEQAASGWIDSVIGSSGSFNAGASPSGRSSGTPMVSSAPRP